METRVFDLRNERLKTGSREEAQALEEAAEILRQGGIVAFPTETVYGLGGDALNPEAVAKIYEAKGRPSDNPMIVHICAIEDLELLTEEADDRVKLLAEAFWPGPLTMVLAKKDTVPDVTTGGLDTVAVRMPDSKIALELIRRTGRPIAAPSANISGRPSPTKGEHVENDLLGKVDGIILGEDCRVGIESTVLDLSGPKPVILRPGTITKEELSPVLGQEVLLESDREVDSPKSPGTKYTHYSPKAEMLILRGQRPLVLAEIERLKQEKSRAKDEAQGQAGPGYKIKVIDFGEKTAKEAARDFFNQLRKADFENVDLIIAIPPENQDSISFALMNRMLKAAGNNVKFIE